MEIIKKLRVKNLDLCFFQSIITTEEGLCAISLGEKEDEYSNITLFYDSSYKKKAEELIDYFKKEKILLEME